MALDAYLQIQDIPGEALDDEHKDWIQIREIQHAIHQSASPSTVDAGGIVNARANHDVFKIKKLVDKASPVLMEKCSSGQSIPKITIEMMRAAGNARVKFMKIDLAESIISDVELAAQITGDDAPSEWVSFNYGKIKWTYTTQARSGDPGGAVPGGWDLTKNKKWAG